MSNTATLVLNTLKYECLHKFSHPLSRSRFNNSGLEGFQSSDVLVVVKSDMHTFIDIAQRQCLDDSRLSTSVRLKPDLCAFHSPSRATNSLSIDFISLSSMLRFMSIMDIADHRTFASRGSVGKQGGMLRLLGSSCLLTLRKSETRSTPVDVDCFLPFTSCSDSQVRQLQEILESDSSDNHSNTTQKPTFPVLPDNLVLYRHRKNYDASQGRFISPWLARRVSWTHFSPESDTEKPASTPSSSTTTSNSTGDSDATFCAEWTRFTQFPKSAWTSDATYTGYYVMGQLTAFFPAVTFFGPSTVAEIETLMTTHCS